MNNLGGFMSYIKEDEDGLDKEKKAKREKYEALMERISEDSDGLKEILKEKKSQGLNRVALQEIQLRANQILKNCKLVKEELMIINQGEPILKQQIKMLDKTASAVEAFEKKCDNLKISINRESNSERNKAVGTSAIWKPIPGIIKDPERPKESKKPKVKKSVRFALDKENLKEIKERRENLREVVRKPPPRKHS